MKYFILTIPVCLLLFTACSPTEQGADEATLPPHPPSPPVEVQPSSDIPETENVFYRGMVRPAGISIYMEGSHKLSLEDGRFVLLESEDLDLNGYVGEEVEVFGAIRPTVEAGGIIMRVERINLVEEEVNDTTEGKSSSSEDAVEEEASSSSTAEDNTDTDDDVPPEDPDPTDTDDDDTDTTPPVDVSPEMQVKIDTMASHKFTADQWTQQYCSSHIGFCIPIHRNWWYKSFGATSSKLWHVEMSSEEVTDLGNGPILVELVSGTVASEKSVDKQVRTVQGESIGYRSWTGNRHFEIRGPLTLKNAITYITENLVENVE
jgi:hypothetical protein